MKIERIETQDLLISRYERLLLEMIVITLMGVICGAEDWRDVEQFGQSR